MAITFHCDYCGKRIEAPDNAGGKWGKCPACHKKLYVPSLSDDEELKVAPIDETDLEKQRQLMAETRELTQDILQERQTLDNQAEATGQLSQMSEKELMKNIILCLRQMADSDLEQAQKIIELIAPHSHKAAGILDKIALSEMPEPELADIPQQVLSGLIRTLRAKIS